MSVNLPKIGWLLGDELHECYHQEVYAVFVARLPSHIVPHIKVFWHCSRNKSNMWNTSHKKNLFIHGNGLDQSAKVLLPINSAGKELAPFFCFPDNGR